MNNVYLYTPQVKETSIFKEIAQNIVNPLVNSICKKYMIKLLTYVKIDI